MESTKRYLRCAALLAAGLAFATGARAEHDHLLGYKAQDLIQSPALATVDVHTGTAGLQNCELKKAQFVMFPAEKNGGDDSRGGPVTPFVCYKAKCPILPGIVDGDTQFGPVSMQSKKAKILCLPASADICIGQLIGGFCWFHGADGESCDTACSNNGLTYDGATETYAGSGGTDENCEAVATAFGVGPYFGNPSAARADTGASKTRWMAVLYVAAMLRCPPQA